MIIRKSFLSPHSVGFAIWITAPWSHRLEKCCLIAPETQASLSQSHLKNIIKGQKSEFLNAISQPTDAPTATTPEPTTDASATCIPLQHDSESQRPPGLWNKCFITTPKSSNSKIQSSTMWHSIGRSWHTGSKAVKWFSATPKCRRCSVFPTSKWS